MQNPANFNFLEREIQSTTKSKKEKILGQDSNPKISKNYFWIISIQTRFESHTFFFKFSLKNSLKIAIKINSPRNYHNFLFHGIAHTWANQKKKIFFFTNSRCEPANQKFSHIYDKIQTYFNKFYTHNSQMTQICKNFQMEIGTKNLNFFLFKLNWRPEQLWMQLLHKHNINENEKKCFKYECGTQRYVWMLYSLSSVQSDDYKIYCIYVSMTMIIVVDEAGENLCTG